MSAKYGAEPRTVLVTLDEAAGQREDFATALRRLGDQATLVAAEFRALEAQWRRENYG